MRPYWRSYSDLLTTGNDLTCEIEKELTKEEAIKKHRQLWGYIAAKIDATKKFVSKSGAFNELFKGESVSKQCFLCEYSIQQKDKSDRCCSKCEFCPLYDKSGEESCLNGLYDNFCNTTDIEKARDYAYKIATLPEVDKRSEPEKLYDNLKEIYHRHFNLTLWGADKSVYVWLLGRKIIKLLDKHKDIDFDSTLFGIEVKEDISNHTTILLCKKVGGDNE